MTWGERALLISAASSLITTLITAPWALIRACQAYKVVREIRKHQLGETK